MNALKDLANHVEGVDTTLPSDLPAGLLLGYRICGKLFRLGFTWVRRPDPTGVNATILRQAENNEWDILWLEKGLDVERDTILRVKEVLPHCRVVGYSPDDMYARHNQSKQFLEHLPSYDAFFTTKSCGVRELNALGCKTVFFVGNAFDPQIHRPMPLTSEERAAYGGPVGFVGAYETERARSLQFLASHGVPVRVWGATWGRHFPPGHALTVEPRNVWADDYAKTICAFDINFGFLRKINRDQQTTRSIEIPACGAFMLAERTDEHLALFEEGREAEFFGSDDELLDKTRFYLAHEEARRRIAASGRERCLKSGYSNQERLRKMLETVSSLN